MGDAFKLLLNKKQKEIVKWNSEFCGTSKNLKRWKEQTHQKCPVCGYNGETTDHILRCPHPESKQAWKKSIAALENWMTQHSTAPKIISAIINNINSWRDNHPTQHYERPTASLHNVIQQQEAIGWAPLLRGFVHTGWKEVQH